jgi:hypothetical protein
MILDRPSNRQRQMAATLRTDPASVQIDPRDYVAMQAGAQNEIQQSVPGSLRRGDWGDAMGHVALFNDTVLNRAAAGHRGDSTPFDVLTEDQQFSHFPSSAEDHPAMAQALDRRVKDLQNAYLRWRATQARPAHANVNTYRNPGRAKAKRGWENWSPTGGYGRAPSDHEHGDLDPGRQGARIPDTYKVDITAEVPPASPWARAVPSGWGSVPKLDDLQQGRYAAASYGGPDATARSSGDRHSRRHSGVGADVSRLCAGDGGGAADPRHCRGAGARLLARGRRR